MRLSDCGSAGRETQDHARRSRSWAWECRSAAERRQGGEIHANKPVGRTACCDKKRSPYRTPIGFMFGNSEGQPYTTSGWNTNLRRLMAHAETKAKKGRDRVRAIRLERHAVGGSDRPGRGGNETIRNATGHSSDRMVRQIYDQRRKKAAKAIA